MAANDMPIEYAIPGLGMTRARWVVKARAAEIRGPNQQLSTTFEPTQYNAFQIAELQPAAGGLRKHL